MVKFDAFIVIFLGNVDLNASEEEKTKVDIWPYCFAEEDKFKDNILVVGSVKLSGEISDFLKRGLLVKIFVSGESFTQSGEMVAST